VGGEKCQPIGLLQLVGMGGNCGGQCSWTETLCDQGK
jgi:hypothetical protein